MLIPTPLNQVNGLSKIIIQTIIQQSPDINKGGSLFGSPPLSDPIQPERGLLGFLKGLLSIDYKGGNLGYYVWVIADDLMRHFDGPTPEIAAAKALIAQEQK